MLPSLVLSLACAACVDPSELTGDSSVPVDASMGRSDDLAVPDDLAITPADTGASLPDLTVAPGVDLNADLTMVGVMPDLATPDLVVSACANMKLDNDETDVDCGGKTCAACPHGKTCKQGSDCLSNRCTAGKCVGPLVLAFGAPVIYGNRLEIAAVVGDFSGDGKPDIAVADWNSNPGTGYTFLGKGDGSFPMGVAFSLAVVQPRDLTASDFNGDGKLDIASAGFCGMQSGGATIGLGVGDGSFNGGQCLRTMYYAGLLTSGDVTGDGKADLVVCDGQVAVFPGLGDGNVGMVKEYDVLSPAPGGGGSTAVRIGDLNNDGRPDIAATVSDNMGNPGWLSVLLNSGNGFFQLPALKTGVGLYPAAIALGEINGDGRLDAVIVNSSGNTSAVLLGSGNGMFGQPQSRMQNAPVGVAVADFDLDGKLDYVVANQGGNNLIVWPGNGDGTFLAAVPVAVGGPQPATVTAADLNGDGKPDLVTTLSGLMPGVSVILNTSK